MKAIIQHTKTHVLILCPLGHLLETHKNNEDFGGSQFEAELTFRHEGDRFERMAANCKGYGHAKGEMIPRGMALQKSLTEKKEQMLFTGAGPKTKNELVFESGKKGTGKTKF